MSHGRPAKCTGRMARVLGVTALSIRAGSMFCVRRSTSTKTGVAPVCTMELAVAANVCGVVMTSLPGPTPAAIIERWRAAVHELSARACRAPT